jgi:hypothetical protein
LQDAQDLPDHRRDLRGFPPQPRRLRWRRWWVLAAVVPAMVVYLGAPPMALMVAGGAGGAIGWGWRLSSDWSLRRWPLWSW